VSEHGRDDPPVGAGEAAKYDAAEERALREAYAAAGRATCPRCGVAMTVRHIGGGSFGLGYARRREWLICPSCRRSAIFDVKRGTRN
jgi:hypothetical protein